MDALRKEARDYYDNLLMGYFREKGYKHPIESILDDYDLQHPGLNAYQLKAAQYQLLAEHFSPHVFDNAPFYFATDLLPGIMDGRPDKTPGGWLFRRNNHLYRDANPDAFDSFYGQMAKNIHLCCGPYADVMHYCFPIPNVIKYGLEGIYKKAEAALSLCTTTEEQDFTLCAIAGLLAAKRISERFADAAKKRLEIVTDPAQRRFLSMIERSARLCPWKKPAHFFEGLNAMWFCRDVCGVIDGIGNSHLGRPDHLLDDLYQKDIASGYMTSEEAYDLISRFLMLGDCHYNKDVPVVGYSDHELEMGVVLGGCDENGKEVYNEITRMFIQAHREQHLIYPKLHFRYRTSSSKEYLDEIAKDFLNGRSIGGLVNDDSVIPALVSRGKTLEDARCYVNTGCWGVMVEGMESCAGGNYFHLLTIMELSVHGAGAEYEKIGIHIKPLDSSQSFDEVYDRFFDNVIRPLRQRCIWIGKYGRLAPTVNPIPLFSACMAGCLDQRKDFTAGGAKYNGNEFDPTGFANVIDGLLAIKTLCFDQKYIGLNDFLDAVRSNWVGFEELRLRIQRCPYFGDEGDESISLSRRLFNDLYDQTRDLVNEHGGDYGMDFYVYREFRLRAEQMRATPDGRRYGDLYAMGICPTRYHRENSLPATLRSISALDSEKSINHSLNVQLPAGRMNLVNLEALLRVMAASRMKHIQINCVDTEILKDARIHPELHQDLIVRVCGFSAKFVALSPEWQEEFITRNVYQAV